jgi:hypothetical protein
MRKYVVTLLLVISTNVLAQGVIAEGKIKNTTVALTDIPCDIPKTYIVYVYQADGKTSAGCWASDESRVVVSLPYESLRTYSHGFFSQREIR